MGAQESTRRRTGLMDPSYTGVRQHICAPAVRSQHTTHASHQQWTQHSPLFIFWAAGTALPIMLSGLMDSMGACSNSSGASEQSPPPGALNTHTACASQSTIVGSTLSIAFLGFWHRHPFLSAKPHDKHRSRQYWTRDIRTVQTHTAQDGQQQVR